MKKILKVEKLKKNYGLNKIVNNISFDVLENSLFAFLGPNGAGKSTTMNILSTILEKSSGVILIDNKLLTKKDKDIKKNIGYVFQNNILDDELTVYENLYLRCSLYGLSKKKLHKNIIQISNELNITPFLDKKYKICSGGQKRLAMIAKSLIYSPKILILDEPTVGLDPQIRKLVWEKLLQIKKEKKLTIFFSTHYIEEAIYADKICIIDKGQIIFNQNKNAFLEKYDYKRLKIKEKDKEYVIDLNDVKEALNTLNKIKKDNLISFKFENSSLDDIFIKLINEGKGKNEDN